VTGAELIAEKVSK